MKSGGCQDKVQRQEQDGPSVSRLGDWRRRDREVATQRSPAEAWRAQDEANSKTMKSRGNQDKVRSSRTAPQLAGRGIGEGEMERSRPSEVPLKLGQSPDRV